MGPSVNLRAPPNATRQRPLRGVFSSSPDPGGRPRMKILVCLKQVPHQDARLDVRADGAWIQEDNIKFEINSYDTYALEEALRVKDKGETEVVVASIGPERVTQAL